MDNSIVIKGSKHGIRVILDEKEEYGVLLEQIREKFREASKFLGSVNMAVSFEGRKLTSDEENTIVDIITEETDLKIVCILGKDQDVDRVFEEAVSKALGEMEGLSHHTAKKADIANNVHDTDAHGISSESDGVANDVNNVNGTSDDNCHFYKGTLRSGQVFESDSSVVILGDVNPGAKVVSKGNVVVLGSLRGNIFAGACGNENAFVVALEMNPMQIKIGEIIARSEDSSVKIKGKTKASKVKILEPKIAYVYDSNIYIEDLNQEVLADITI